MSSLLSKMSGINGLTIAFVFLMMACGSSQEKKARVSTAASVSQTLGESTEIVISYSRPGVKGRKIWGELVPFDKVWRTGANEATTISFSDDVLINGEKLAAGKYALFTQPGKTEWQIIFNSTADQWGAYDREPEKDVLSVTVKPETALPAEWLTFEFEQLDGTTAVAAMRWEKLKVPFKIATTKTGGKIRASLKAGLSQTIGLDTNIELVFSRPGVKGRKIWGELVPFGKVWRSGANENTVFSVSKDVLVDGQKLPAGDYGFHAIPGENEWTIIFSKNAAAWGSFDYDPSEDALRVTVKPQPAGSFVEWMQFAIPALTPAADKTINAAQVALQWENLQVPFSIALP